MKILVNCSNLKKGGGLQIAHSIITELEFYKKHDIYFIISNSLEEYFGDDSYTLKNLNFYRHDIHPNICLSLTGKEPYLRKIEEKINPDIVFTVFGPSYWKPKNKHLCGYAKPQYIYSESPYFSNINLFKSLKIYLKKIFHLYDFRKFNDALVTESKSVSEKVQNLLIGKLVFTVSNTYNQIFDDPTKWDNGIKLPEFDGVTLLTISANYLHKNLTIIPKVYKYLKIKYPDFKVRFVTTVAENEFPKLTSSEKNGLIFLGKINIIQCPYLYQQADFMFLPTLLECFSASYPEAMKMEVPILTSDLPFARGICGDAAVYFDPISAQNIGDTIFSLATNKALRSELVEKGKNRLVTFGTSEKRVQKYIEILENIHEANSSEF